MLCASAYTAKDYASFGLFKGKTYKWGYFPECKNYDAIEGLLKKKNFQEILWCGRFLDWKHPDDVLTVAKRLKEENIRFHINMIGTGEMGDTLNQMVLDNDLTDFVLFLGSMPPEQVREHMERAGIYLCTSDRKEGWGAVLNEAMNGGCAVVASTEAGSTPYMIRHGENGMAYSSCRVDELYKHVKHLLQHPEEQRQLGKAAYETIVTLWNADIAAERLYALCEKMLEGEKHPNLYADGPCSITG
jgi:glycosyltransferase involved in cell wall biosynthesis